MTSHRLHPAPPRSSRSTTTPSLSFDKVPVLKEHSLPLVINNCSAIPADFKLFIESKDSVFSVEPRQAHLEPGDSLTAHVMVKMDESMDFADTLHVLIQEGADMAIPLTSSGGCGCECGDAVAGRRLCWGAGWAVADAGLRPLWLECASAMWSSMKSICDLKESSAVSCWCMMCFTAK